MSENMQKMIGFRNIAIHDYKQIDEKILQDVIENHLVDLTDFARAILNLKRQKYYKKGREEMEIEQKNQ